MTARELAYKTLKTALSGNTYSNIAIDNVLKKNELSEADAGLMTNIVMGVTERRLTLDHIINKLSENPDRIDSDTKVLLRMGIYQIVFLDRIPAYAAVNETVDLAPKRSRGFVNAVLRSLLRMIDKNRLGEIFPEKDEAPSEYLSVKYSFPTDMCDRFIEIYGYERTQKIFEIFNDPPVLTLRINTLKISTDEYLKLLDEKGIAYTRSPLLNHAVMLRDVGFSSLPGYNEGYFFVQDTASQICVEAIGAEPGQLMIDACSCPGSKSFGSAINMKNEGKIFSFDLHESKLKLVKSGAERLGIDIIEESVRDGRIADENLVGRADRVLCDVPCSGLGVIAKKPEIRYKSLKDFERLPEIQLDILENCSKYLKNGGVLVYSTCTVLPEENCENVKRFLKRNPEFETMDFCVGDIRSDNGMLSLSPDIHGTDGFFVSKLIKK